MSGLNLLLVLGCFLLSGLAALIYQTAWTQQFALVFGTSELAVVAVLAAYMAGLAAGAAWSGRWVARLRRPLLVYALLELGIAAAALAVPLGLDLASRLHVLALGGVELPPESTSFASALFYLVAAFVVLLVPTALMGASLPVLVRHAVHADDQIGSRVGWLYAVNTAGAAGGTLLAAYVLLPRFGLQGTVWAAVAVNLAVFLLALGLARGPRPDSTAALPRPGAVARPAGDVWILPVMLASGFFSFCYEVLWTRLLSHLLGGTLYAFATMLATFLIGITLGAAAASFLAATARRARMGFVAAQLGIALCSLGAFHASDLLPAIASGLEAGASFANATLLAAATLLPGALFIGSTFPLAVRIRAGSAAEAGPASGQVFAWNTTGAILGAVVSGFVLLPVLRFEGTLLLASIGGVALALVAALAGQARRWQLATAALAALAAVLWWRPESPERVLRTSPLTGQPVPGRLVFSAVGRSATTLLLRQRAGWRLTTNGLPESVISPRGSRIAGASITHWLGLLPLAARPDAESVLVIGFGGGRTLESFPPSVDHVHVVELEPEVIRANRLVANQRTADPLADPRLSIHLNDARSGLKLAGRGFDAIVSQPSHPWTAGASHLFTREFFDLVRQRLNPGGVFVQWIGLPFVDEQLLESLLAALNDVFEHVELYHPPPGGAVLFLASDEVPVTEASATRSIADGAGRWQQLGVFTAEDVLAARILNSAAARRIAAGALVNRDNRNLLRLRPPGYGLEPMNQRRLWQWLGDFDVLRGWQPRDGSLYLLRRLIAVGQRPRARRLAADIGDPHLAAVATALVDLATPRREQAGRALREALAANPESDEAFYAVMEAHQADVIRGQPPDVLTERIATDAVARTITRGWQLSSARDSGAIRELEPELAGIDPTHALFANATRLRVAWRLASGESAEAAEGIALYDAVLALGANRQELLIRARLGFAAGRPEVVLATLAEIAGGMGPRVRRSAEGRALVRESLSLLDALPRDESLERRVSDLRAQLTRPLPQAAGSMNPEAQLDGD